MRDLAWLPLGVLAALAADQTVRRLRGSGVGTLAGFGFAIGCAVAAAALKVMDIAFTDGWTRQASSTAAELTYVAAVFSMLGAFHDHARDPRPALLSIPLLIGGASFALLGLTPQTEIEWAAAGVCVIVLMANLFDLLGRSPGRAGKLFILATVGLLIPGGTAAPGIAIGIGAGLAVTWLGLRRPVPLGSAGGLGMGTFLGWAVIVRGDHPAWRATLIGLVLLNALALRFGVDRLFDLPVLRAFDRAGRRT